MLPPEGSPGKIRVGFFSFTEVTDPAAHRSYNEWHQLDHLPEQLPMAGIAWGGRWVCSPRCRVARAVSAPLLEPVHYLTLYLMEDPIGPTLDAFAALGGELRRLGRFHEQRASHLSGPFDVLAAHATARVLVSGAAVPYRPSTGVYVVVEEAVSDDTTWEAVDPAPLLAAEGVAGVWSFAASSVPGRWDPGRRRVTVCFLDGDPLDVSDGMRPLVSSRSGWGVDSEVVFAGPFEAVTPWKWDWFDDEGPVR